jgi:phage terminase large subunit-like protein
VEASISGTWLDFTSWRRIVSKQTVGFGEFFDLQVPGVHSYLAEGVWHHNSGKTDACAEYVVRHVNGPACMPGPVPHWIGIIAPTLGDAATACVEGPSGIRAHDPSAKGPIAAPGGSVVRWPNGSQAKLFGTDSPGDVERLRAGGNTCLIWAEELAAWRHLDDAWDQMRFGLRSGPRPHWIASTTPKPKPIIKRLVAGEITNAVLTTATTYDNPHLPEHIRQALEESYGGTQLGQQELLGLIMDQEENALWTRNMIDAARMRPGDLPELVRTVVGVDPSGGAGEQGIVVAGKSGLILPLQAVPDDGTPPRPTRPEHHGYVLDDRTCHLPPDGWGRRAVQAAIDWDADEITCEVNYGGDLAVATIRTAAEAMGVNIPIRKVTATRGKQVRAHPVSALTAQGRWHHAGAFEALESQLCTWYPEIGWSPDRLDAMVWTAWQMKLVGTSARGVGSLGGDLARRSILPGRTR